MVRARQDCRASTVGHFLPAWDRSWAAIAHPSDKGFHSSLMTPARGQTFLGPNETDRWYAMNVAAALAPAIVVLVALWAAKLSANNQPTSLVVSSDHYRKVKLLKHRETELLLAFSKACGNTIHRVAAAQELATLPFHLTSNCRDNVFAVTSAMQGRSRSRHSE